MGHSKVTYYNMHIFNFHCIKIILENRNGENDLLAQWHIIYK